MSVAPVPELVPISKLRQTQNEILGKVPQSPVVLTQHGEAVAVLVSPEMWNRLLDDLETWQDSFDALETKYRIAIGEEEVLDWEEVKGDYRVIDEIEDDEQIVTVLRAGHRRDVYRGL